MNTKTVIIICGPTAAGKTNIAFNLAKQLSTEIISADSRQCYQEMNIGTAKPTTEQLQDVKHYFINEFSISKALTAKDFETLSLQYLNTIFENHDTALVCGGTGLYIKALCEGLDDMPESDPKIVAQIEKEFEEKGIEWLQAKLISEDYLYEEHLELQNPARLIRALSFKRSTGESIINYRTFTKKERPFRIIKIGIDLPRIVLYYNINRRVDAMMQSGFLEEAKQLFPFRQLKNLQTVGYNELFEYLDGNYTLPYAIEKIKQNTRNYAKRQLTWFNKDTDIHWLQGDDENIMDKILNLAFKN